MSDRLEDDYEALVQFLYIAPIGLLQARIDGEILMVNPLCAQLLMPLAADTGLSNVFDALEPLLPDLRMRVSQFEPDYGLIFDGLQLRLSLNPVDRRAVQYLSLSLLKLDANRLMAVLGDVTQSVMRERELRQSQALVHTIVSGITDYALLTLDERGVVQAWNPSVQRLTGHPRHSVQGQSYGVFYAQDAITPEGAEDRLFEANRSGWSVDEGWLRRADGTRFWGSCLIAPLHVPGDQMAEAPRYSLIMRDVSERREASDSLRRAVNCDHLTGLANRRSFFDAAELEVTRWKRTPRPLSLLLIDADHFKSINDTYGHAVGDAVLRHLAAGLSASFRSLDVIARLGGEEFVVLLPGATIDSAEASARRLAHNIASQTVRVGGVPIRYTVSVGVASMDSEVDCVDALLARADSAMYVAKAAGRNRAERWHPGTAVKHAIGGHAAS